MTPHPDTERLEEGLLRLGQALKASGYQFTTITPASHARVLARQAPGALAAPGQLRDVFGWSMPFQLNTLSPDMLGWLEQAGGVLPDALGCRSAYRFSSLGPLLLAHSAYPTVAADSVFFGPDTYRFCTLLDHFQPRAETAVDIGSGSGAGGLWLAVQRPMKALTLTDINPKALAVARANARLAGLSVHTLESDLFAALPELPELCIANPPYMRDTQKRAYRDGGGVHGEGLSIRIVQEWLLRARPGQELILYTGSAIVAGRDPIAERTHALARAHGAAYEHLEMDPDVFGEELSLPGMTDVDRIAAIGIRLRR